jgi:hypothetical protein
VPAIVSVFFIFFGSSIKRYEKIEFVSLLSPPSSHRHQQGLWFLVMQDINKKEGFSHPFFLNLLGFVGQGLSACPVLKKC